MTLARLVPAGVVLAACMGTGCASTPYKAKLPATAEMACITDFTDATRTALHPLDAKATEKLAYVEFADIAQCHRNGEGSTPFALYALQDVSPPAEVKVSVLLSTGGTFAAAVDVLDAGYRSLQRHGFDAFVRRGDEYSLTLFLNTLDPAPAYLVLLPDLAQIGRKDVAIGSASSSTVIPAGTAMFVYSTGTETSSIREFMTGGRIKVTVRPQANVGFGAGR